MEINEIKEVLHRIKVKLYPNYLLNVEGAYIARTISEATLSIEQICAALKNRGGFTGNYDDLIDYVRQYNAEVAYQLCNGFAVSNGYFSLHPNIGGSFNSENDTYDRKKHPISFHFRTLSKLRRIMQYIEVEIEGLADSNGYIGEFMDFDENSSNTLYSPGDQFALYGYKIKITGNDPAVGMYFVPVDDPSKAVKVTRMAENTASKITGIAPQTNFTRNRIEVRTQFTGSGSSTLKTPRVITSNFILEEA